MPLDFRATLDDSSFQKGISAMTSAVQALSAGALASAGKAILDFAGDIADMSEATGLSAESFQELSGVFAQSGVEGDKFGKAMGTIQQKLEAARNGSEEAIQSFEKLGIGWQQIVAASPEEMLGLVADGLKNSTNETEAFAAASELLGKGQLKLIGALKGGSEALNDQRKAISTLAADEVKALDDAGDAITRFWTQAKVVGAKGLVGLKDAFAGLFDEGMGTENFESDAVRKQIIEQRAANRLRREQKSSVSNRSEPMTGGAADPRLSKEAESAAKRFFDEQDTARKQLAKQDDDEWKRLMAMEKVEEKRVEMQREFYEDGLSSNKRMVALDEDRLELQEKLKIAADDEKASIQDKLNLKELEIQKEKRLQKEQHLGQLQDALSRTSAHGKATFDAAVAFGLLSNDERRATVREERRVRREEDRQKRLLEKNPNGDTRFGARNKERSLATVALDIATIRALSAELDKLIAR